MQQDESTTLPLDFKAPLLIQRTGKAAVFEGLYRGHPAVAKVLRSTEQMWREALRMETLVYNAKAEAVHFGTPTLLWSAPNAVIMTRLPGAPLAPQRYLPPDVPLLCLRELIDALVEVATLRLDVDLSGRTLTPQGLTTKVEKLACQGYADPKACQAVQTYLSGDQAPTLAHGDPIPSNVLISNGRIGLIDWEHVGFCPPAYDLAMLWIISADAPTARDLILDFMLTRSLSVRSSFHANLIYLLGREIRLFSEAELPESPSRIAEHAASLRRLLADGPFLPLK
jgi:hypothetical protein